MSPNDSNAMIASNHRACKQAVCSKSTRRNLRSRRCQSAPAVRLRKIQEIETAVNACVSAGNL